MRNKLELKDIVNIFLTYSIHQIKSESEVPNINFNFKQDGFDLFKKVINDKEVDMHKASKSDIDFLSEHLNDDCLTLNINDSICFFEKLKDIINESTKLFHQYGDKIHIRQNAIHVLRRIWLRMGVNDISNVDSFLTNQLQFVRNKIFDNQDSIKVSTFQDCDVFMKTIVNEWWDESTRSMVFTLKNDEEEYELPHVLYDINDKGICYIYAVQSSKKTKNKHIERKIYSLNKGIKNPNVHPSKVYSLLLFIEQLKSKNIKKIIVPGMQVFSYHYHELLNIEAKRNLEEIKEILNMYPDDDYAKNRYRYMQNWYDHVYQKQDLISYLKTEELIYLIYRIIEHDPSIELLNEINIQDDSLNIRLR